MRKLLKRSTHEDRRKDRGATVVEYALLVSAFGLAIGATVNVLDDDVNAAYSVDGNDAESVRIVPDPGAAPVPPPPAPPPPPPGPPPPAPTTTTTSTSTTSTSTTTTTLPFYSHINSWSGTSSQTGANWTAKVEFQLIDETGGPAVGYTISGISFKKYSPTNTGDPGFTAISDTCVTNSAGACTTQMDIPNNGSMKCSDYAYVIVTFFPNGNPSGSVTGAKPWDTTRPADLTIAKPNACN